MITVESLNLGYEDRLVLEDLNFRVGTGEFVGLLGPNGSGKSTLLQALSGLLPPKSGRITICDEHLGAIPHRLRAQRLAVVPQSVDMRFPFTCLEIVLMGRYPRRRRLTALTEADLLYALQSMHHTTTEHLKDRPVTEVSGGECQRVVIARALAQASEILLLDEATSSLDVRKKLEIFEVLTHLNATHGLTVVCAMHDLNLAALYCRRLMFLKDRRIVVDGETGAVFTPEVLGRVFETPMEVVRHPVHQRPYAVMLPLAGSEDELTAAREAAI